MSGSQHDVIKVARQILNRGNAHRTVPKQECMVELAELPLVLCSETTETINLSGSYKLSSSTHNTLLSQYRKAATTNPTLSLHDFVSNHLKEKSRKSGKIIIPHYVGANGQPKYPPTKEYAMATLIVHKPWCGPHPPKMSDNQWISEFKAFVESPTCPTEVVLEYTRVKERWESKRPEAVATEECFDREVQPDMDDETRDILGIVTNMTVSSDPFLTLNDYKFDRGLSYDWSTRVNKVRQNEYTSTLSTVSNDNSEVMISKHQCQSSHSIILFYRMATHSIVLSYGPHTYGPFSFVIFLLDT